MHDESVAVLKQFLKSEEERLEDEMWDYLNSIRLPDFIKRGSRVNEEYLNGIRACIERLSN